MNLSMRNIPRVTIIILTYQRHNFIRRQMLYYANYSVQLIFADGSANSWEHGDQGSNANMRWDYIHHPGYDTYRERLYLALEKVHTDYVCLLDDQECILWTGIISAINTLENNPDHSCAGGLVAIYDSLRNDLKAWKGFSKLDLTDSSTINRFNRIVGPEHLAANLVYQVMRTEDLRNFSDNMRDHYGKSAATLEVALAGFLALKGKYLTGQYPYWIRNGGTVPLPNGFEVVIDSAEIKRISLKLIDSLRIKSDLGMQEIITTDTLTEAIEVGWGRSSKWAKDSRKYFEGIRMNKSIKRRLRTKFATIIKAIMPLIYDAYISLKKSEKGDSLSFIEYAKTYSDYSYEVVSDMLLQEKIWKIFPNGIPPEFWPVSPQ